MNLNDKQEGRSDDENAEPSLARREEEETKSMDLILKMQEYSFTTNWIPVQEGAEACIQQ